MREGAQAIEDALRPTAKFCLENNGLYFDGEPHILKVAVNSSGNMLAEVIMTLSTDLKAPVNVVERDVQFQRGETNIEYDLELVPGFYEAVLEIVTADGERFELARSNIGCEPEKVVSPQDKQADFDEFWAQTISDLHATDPQYSLTLLDEYSNDVRRTYRVDMNGFGGEPTCGILVEPVADGCYETVVNFMGYGSEIWYPNPSDAPQRVQFILCNRNQALNRKPDEDNLWCTWGLESKETYYYRGVFADAVRAIDFVCSRPKVDQDRLFVEGGSQGGAITLVAASLDDRIDAIAPSVPFLSDYKDYFQIVEWPGNWILEAAQQKGISEEELYETLSYFDVKNFTDRIQCPVLMGFGLQDATCPPHTNFAGYNMIKAPKRWICYPETGHDVWMEPTWPQEVEDWFREYSM